MDTCDSTTHLLSNDQQSPFITDADQKSPPGECMRTDATINTGHRYLRTKVYHRRWYVMLVFCLCATSQGGSWNVYGPISATTEEALDWTDSDIALLTAWGPIAYLIATFPFAWLLEAKGVRVACLTATFLVLLGAIARCLTTTPPYVTWSSNVAQLLNGLAGPIAFGAPPVISSLWFPASERTTATAINTVLNDIGTSLTFILGPYLVPERKHCNGTAFSGNDSSDTSVITEESQFTNCSQNDTVVLLERRDISKYMLYQVGFVGVSFLLMLVYFPGKPELQPTASASVPRLEFKSAVKELARNVQFWLICSIFGVSQGVFSCWQSLLDLILKPHGISEDEAGWLGFYSLLAGCVVSLVFARFSDVFTRHMRLFLLMLYTMASGCFVWFIFLVQGIITSSTVQLYASIILGTMFLNSTIPLFFEVGCEIAFPVPEGTTNLVLTLATNIGGAIFLLVQMIPNIGTKWASWCMLGGVAGCIPVLALLKEKYNRLEIDETSKTSPPPQLNITTG